MRDQRTLKVPFDKDPERPFDDYFFPKEAIVKAFEQRKVLGTIGFGHSEASTLDRTYAFQVTELNLDPFDGEDPYAIIAPIPFLSSEGFDLTEILVQSNRVFLAFEFEFEMYQHQLVEQKGSGERTKISQFEISRAAIVPKSKSTGGEGS